MSALPDIGQPTLAQVLSGRSAGEVVPDFRGADEPADKPVVPFPGLVLPFVRTGAAWLRGWLSRRRAAPCRLSAEAERHALRGLALRLRAIGTPTAVLELNVARLLGSLEGSTGEERFRHFAEETLAGPPRLRALFAEYPVLARRMCVQLESWFAATTELLDRLGADRHRLARTFGCRSAAVAALGPDLSDPHQGARVVRWVDLEDGTRLVYKPKPMKVDVEFQGLLVWLGGRGLSLAHRTLTVEDRGEYGWVEFVAHQPCLDAEAVGRFYRRLGSQLALLYALQAVDFHHENLIAAGEHPVLVDLESLFHHRPVATGTSAHARALERLQRSVCSVGLLPAFQRSRDGRKQVDLGGMGGRKGATFARPMPRVQDWARDTMRIARGDVALEPGGNSPVLDGEEVDPVRFTDDLVAGFRETYDLIAAARASFGRRLQRFAEASVRYIARPTMRYAMAHHRALHPDHLRSAAGQGRVFDGLSRELEQRPELRPLLAAEIADLERGDVPLFTTRAGSRDLWDSEGRRLESFFPEDGLTRARRELGSFGARDRDEQTGLIRKAMLTLEGRRVFRREARTEHGPVEASPGREGWLEAAVAVGEHLREQAVEGEEDVTWIGLGLRPGPEPAWDLAPLSAGLYDGVGGLALFFAWLGAATGRAEFTALARRAAHRVHAALSGESEDDVRTVGAFWGRSSALYVLAHLAALWDEAQVLEDVLEAELGRLGALIPDDAGLDVLGGAAGCAMVLLGLQDRHPRCLELARLCGERLLERALPQARGVGWIGDVSSAPLAGFSHGSAGIAWALLELWGAFGDARYAAAARRGVEYERTLYVAEARDWLDLRVEPAGLSQCAAWCNGAAGVALGRSMSLRHWDDAEVRQEIEAAVERTLESGFGIDHSLCHGDSGNVEVVLHAAEALGRDDWRAAALREADRVRQAVLRREWHCGLPRRVEAPSLMTGLAGIGYAMLRLWSEAVPSVLRLQGAQPVDAAETRGLSSSEPAIQRGRA